MAQIIRKGDRLIKEYVDAKTGRITIFEPGIKLEVSDFKGEFWPAKVVDVDLAENEILVHYYKYKNKFDEWIKTDSNRLRPCAETNVIKLQFKLGERIEAIWSVDGWKYPGTINAILPNDYYEVLFDDGVKCKKKVSQIFKIQRVTRGRAAAAGRRSSKPVAGASGSPSLDADDESLAKRRGKGGLKKSNSADSSEEQASALERSSAEAQHSDDGNTTLDKSHEEFDSQQNLGKRKRAYHDYSLFLKIPKKSPKRSEADGSSKRKRESKQELKESTRTEDAEKHEAEEESQALDDKGQTTEETPDPAPLLQEMPLKRVRKSSMKAIENIALSSELSPRRKPGRRRSSSVAPGSSPNSAESKSEVTATASDSPAGAHETDSGFIDEKGKAVTIEQTSDGGWICPITKCSKKFRKESLLQMHLKHYHADSKIQFLGKKLNVFEMAIANTRTRTDVSLESIGGSVSPDHATSMKTRRKSCTSHAATAAAASHVDSEPMDEDEDGKELLAESLASTEDSSVEQQGADAVSSDKATSNAGEPEPSAESSVKSELKSVKTDVCVLLEKINVNKYRGPGKSPHVSQRGRRVVAPKKWQRISSDTESEPPSHSSGEEDFAPSPSKQQRTRSRSRKVLDPPVASARLRGQQLRDLLKDKDALDGDGEVAGPSSRMSEPRPPTVPRRANRFQRNSDSGHSAPHPGRPAGSGRGRGRGIPRKSFMSGFKAKSLDLYCDELIRMGKKKKMVAKPRFEDVQVDVINCECGLQEEFGLMMQCELCQSWQHGNCYDIFEVTQLPQYYVCSFCREPQGMRRSGEHEWYQEVNTTGRLPRLSFGPPSDPVAEDRMRTANDLLNNLDSVENLIHSTQKKIALLESKEEHPKLGLWSQDQPNPADSARKEDFRLNFRGLLRHLLKHNSRDPTYISKLRKMVEERTATERNPEDCILQDKLKNRLQTRAMQMVKEEQTQHCIPLALHSRDPSGGSVTTETFMGETKGSSEGKTPFSLSPMDSYFFSCPDLSSPAAAGRPPPVEEQIKMFKMELLHRLKQGSVPVFQSKDGTGKYVLVTNDVNTTVGPTTKMSRIIQKVVTPDGGISDQVLGLGRTLPTSSGLNFVQIVQPQPRPGASSSGPDNQIVHVRTLKKLHLCKTCKKNLKSEWSPKDLARKTNLCMNCASCEHAEASSSSSQLQRTESMKKCEDVVIPALSLSNLDSNKPPSDELDLEAEETAARCKSLKVLCEDIIAMSKVRDRLLLPPPPPPPPLPIKPTIGNKQASQQSKQTEASPGSQRSQPSVPPPKKVTSKRCRINLHATIIKEQLVLDLHLDTIENKLKELETIKLADPQAALARLKDLEELKKKVHLINKNIEFMRNLGAAATTTTTTTTTAETLTSTAATATPATASAVES